MISAKQKNTPVDTVKKEKLELLTHTIFNYCDKFVNLLAPLVVIKIFHNELLYNNIEYILSTSIILSVLVDFGLSSYYFYGYRQSEDKKEYIISIERCFFVLFAIQAIFVSVFIGLYFITFNKALIFYICLFVRTLFLSYTNFKFNTYRALDQPSKIFYITIPVNLFSIAIFYFIYTQYSTLVIYYFVGLFIFELFYIGYSLFKHSDLRLKQFLPLLKTSIVFAWPLMVNVFLLNTINNYGKIYAFKHLPPISMTNLSLMQRFMIIIQLAHTASASFFLKKIFDRKSVTIDFKILKDYSSSIGISVVLVVICMVVNNYFHLIIDLPFDMSFWFLILFFLCYSYGAYLSTYFTLLNKNNMRMYSSIVTIVVFMAFLLIFNPSSLYSLTFIMFISMLSNLGYTLYFLGKNNVLKSTAV